MTFKISKRLKMS